MKYFCALPPHLAHLVRAGYVKDGPGGLPVRGPAVGQQDVVVSDGLLAPRNLALVHHGQVCNRGDIRVVMKCLASEYTTHYYGITHYIIMCIIHTTCDHVPRV